MGTKKNSNSTLFITLEGMEGAGKSTHMEFMAGLLTATGKEVIVTREPGGTALGDQIRNILLQQNLIPINGMTELLMMFAARAQHVQQIIKPALQQGKTVICDRFTDSSYAYQGGGRGIPANTITRLARIVHPGLRPDLTLLFDLPVETGLQRAHRGRVADRFESEPVIFFQAVRKTYLQIADSDPDRVKIINADMDVASVQSRIRQVLENEGLC
jgi:thymidylate kinase